jgi:hypothetical protein|nr:MAG TPA: hypothetical protein [Caudoviricetes sp.]
MEKEIFDRAVDMLRDGRHREAVILLRDNGFPCTSEDGGLSVSLMLLMIAFSDCFDKEGE